MAGRLFSTCDMPVWCPMLLKCLLNVYFYLKFFSRVMAVEFLDVSIDCISYKSIPNYWVRQMFCISAATPFCIKPRLETYVKLIKAYARLVYIYSWCLLNVCFPNDNLSQISSSRFIICIMIRLHRSNSIMYFSHRQRRSSAVLDWAFDLFCLTFEFSGSVVRLEIIANRTGLVTEQFLCIQLKC